VRDESLLLLLGVLRASDEYGSQFVGFLLKIIETDRFDDARLDEEF